LVKHILRLVPFLFLVITAKAQETSNVIAAADTFVVRQNKLFELKHNVILPASVRFWLKSKPLNNELFEFIPLKNSYKIKKSNESIDTLVISYKAVITGFENLFCNRQAIYADSSLLKTGILQNTKIFKPLRPDDIFGKNISRSGSITRGITVSTNKDMTVNSGLNLQISGKISDDIEIVAALADQNLPFQAEGNTERLEELDKVFVQIKHENFQGTFGDYEVNLNNGQFGKVNRKLKGLNAEFNYKDFFGSVSAASSRGKFHSNQISGQDGIQGPYRIRGKNNEREIIIIAGSEKVYLDGIKLKRGESNDYVIDYSTSEIKFTPKQLITSKSRIAIDFEYSDRKYSRTFFNTTFSKKIFNNKLFVSFSYTREGDDESSPIELELSDEEKKILKSAGYNKLNAFVSGVKKAKPDSTGKVNGYYVKKDTLISESNYTYYKYLPGNAQALYVVTFSYVGQGKGDYNKIALGNYAFAGIKKGEYLPIKLLPLPELLETGNIVVKSTPVKDFTIDLEFAGSINNKNRFAININALKGIARNIFVRYNPKKLLLLGIEVPEIDFSVRDRFINKDFNSFNRINSVEFNREYSSNLINTNSNELLREYNFGISPFENLYTGFLYGQLKNGNELKTERYNYNIGFNNNLVNLRYNYDKTGTNTQALNSRWIKQNARASWSPGKFTFGVNYLYDNNKKYKNSDSLFIESYKYYQIKPFAEYTGLKGISIKSSVTFREEFKPLAGKMKREAGSVAHNYEINYTKIREFRTNLLLTIRNKNYADQFKSSSNSGKKSILLRSQSRINFFERFVDGTIFYETSTQRSAGYQKIFVRVRKGTGNYRYVGDLNKNGVAEENEFEPAKYDADYILTVIPTEKMYPIIDLKTNLRFKLNFAKLFNKKSLVGKIFSHVQTETIYRIEENSRIKDISKIYLLKQKYFMNDSTTIRGANIFQQDIHLFRSKRNFSLRFRFLQRRRMFQYSTGTEKGYYRQRTLRLRAKLIDEFSNETEYMNITNNNLAPVSSNRSRKITSNSLSTEIIYKPSREIESGFKIIAGRSIDNFPGKPTTVNTNSQTFRFNYSFTRKGRLRLELERTELGSDNTDNYIPFEISNGNAIGFNYYIRLYFDYKINSFIQTSFNYNGRKNAGGDFIHSMRAEARAFF